MTTNFQKTADDARQLLRGFKALSELADAFENTASLVQAAAEGQRQLTKLRADIVGVEADAANVKAAAKKLVDDAKARVEKIEVQARDTNAELRDNAIASAARITAEANEQVRRAIEAADKAHEELEAASQAKQLAQAELASLEERIAKARAAIFNLLKQE